MVVRYSTVPLGALSMHAIESARNRRIEDGLGAVRGVMADARLGEVRPDRHRVRVGAGALEADSTPYRRDTIAGHLLPAAARSCASRSLAFSSAWSTLQLSGRCRTGNSSNDLRYSLTRPIAGRMRNSRSDFSLLK